MLRRRGIASKNTECLTGAEKVVHLKKNGAKSLKSTEKVLNLAQKVSFFG